MLRAHFLFYAFVNFYVALVDPELLTLPEHLISHLVFSGVRVTRSLVLYICLLVVECPFVLFLLAIVLSVLLRYTDSDCLFLYLQALLKTHYHHIFNVYVQGHERVAHLK
jgi:hypothetical protein